MPNDEDHANSVRRSLSLPLPLTLALPLSLAPALPLTLPLALTGAQRTHHVRILHCLRHGQG